VSTATTIITTQSYLSEDSVDEGRSLCLELATLANRDLKHLALEAEV